VWQCSRMVRYSVELGSIPNSANGFLRFACFSLGMSRAKKFLLSYASKNFKAAQSSNLEFCFSSVIWTEIINSKDGPGLGSYIDA
jgi:hypothetical protein